MFTYGVVLRSYWIISLILLLNILFEHLHRTAGDAPGSLLWYCHRGRLLVEGSCALFLVFGTDLLFFMLFYLMLQVGNDELCWVVMDLGELLVAVVGGFHSA